MKALIRSSNKAFDMKLTEIEEPILEKDDWIKVRVEYAGICATDVKFFAEDLSNGSWLKPPVIPGHEASGMVVQVGKNVDNVKVGSRVVYMTNIDNCFHCHYCFSGDWGLCIKRKGLGSSMNGSFAEYVIMPARNAFIIPDFIDLKTACLAEPLGCAVRLIEEMGKVKRGENVVIMGPGSLGACCAIVARANGANVIVVGTRHSSHRLKIIESMGFSCLINEDNIPIKVEEVFGQKADVSVEAVGKEDAFTAAIDSVRSLGRVVVGAADEKSTGYKVNVNKLLMQQIQIISAHSTRPESWLSAIEILKSYHLVLSKLATNLFPPQEWEAAFDLAKSGEAFKVMDQFLIGLN